MCNAVDRFLLEGGRKFNDRNEKISSRRDHLILEILRDAAVYRLCVIVCLITPMMVDVVDVRMRRAVLKFLIIYRNPYAFGFSLIHNAFKVHVTR